MLEQFAFALLEAEHSFLHRSRGDQLVNGDLFVLTVRQPTSILNDLVEDGDLIIEILDDLPSLILLLLDSLNKITALLNITPEHRNCVAVLLDELYGTLDFGGDL